MNSFDFGIKMIESESSFSGSSSDDSVGDPKDQAPLGFVSPDPFYYISMIEHLNNIDSTIISRTQAPDTFQFYDDDDDYCLDQISFKKQLGASPRRYLETVQCVLTVIAHPLQYPKINSDYSNKCSDFLEWKE